MKLPPAWREFVPKVVGDSSSKLADGLMIAELPSGCIARLWIDFDINDANSKFVVLVWTWCWENRRLRYRYDVEISRPDPGRPVGLVVNGAVMNYDGLMCFELDELPVDQEVTITQTAGVAATLRCLLT